jgi:hypothetical protein
MENGDGHQTVSDIIGHGENGVVLRVGSIDLLSMTGCSVIHA